jgi:hypothetical protein
MVSNLICGVDDAIGSFPTTPALIDSPTLESDAADDRRAMLEMGTAETADHAELQEALASIVAAFPDKDVSVGVSDNRHFMGGRWIHSTHWIATILNEDFSGFDDESPLRAVKKLITIHRKATAPVRATPIHQPITAASFEAFGTIDPATTATFLNLVDEHHGRSDFLTIEPDGRVMLATGEIEGSEAQAIGEYVVMHNLTPERIAAEEAIQIRCEPRGGCFKAVLILPSGERIEVPNVGATESDARIMARAAIVARRSTIAPVAIVASTTHAA